MAVLDKPMRKVALQLIRKFGASIVYRKITRGTYDTSAGTVPEATQDFPIKGIVDRVRETVVGTNLKAGDWRITIAALAIPAEPTTNDLIIFGVETLRVLAVWPTYSGDQAASYQIHARR